MKLRIAAVFAGLLLALAGFFVWIAQSDWLRGRVLTGIVTEAERVTGGAVKLKAFRFDWRTLTAEVDEFEIRGTEPADQAPLLTVDKIRVGLTIISLLARDIRVKKIEAIRPRAHLILLANGKTNIPAPKIRKTGKGAAQTILDLKIGQFDARNGEFLLADTVTPWEARGEKLEAQIAYEPKGGRYSGTVGVAALHVKQFDVQLTASAAMELDRIIVVDAKLRTAGSEVNLRNTMMHHFADPVWTGQYEAKVALKEFLKGAQGTAVASGSGRFVSPKDYQVTGNMTGSGIGFELFRNMSVAADFDAGPEKVFVKRANIRVMGGEVVGSGELLGFERFKASGRLEHFGLAQVATLRTKQKLPYDGIIGGSFKIEGTMRNQRGQAQLVISPVKAGAPVRGNIQVKFDTGARRIELGHSSIDLPHSHVEVAGTLGDRLDVQVDSSDAKDLLPFLLEKAKPDVGWGGMAFRGTVSGPLDHPMVAGSATGRDVRYQKYTVGSVAGDF
ncbi:MAG: translocation and assembly module TamB, partial [Bryobacterales bacterium]|nr:translocation and assembly module TamB [Bryobacterales bacterium]